MHPPFSLDQLATFIAVVEEGSFSAAGRRLGRVQSGVSYTIAQLEEALGSKLFERSGRRPLLTDEGRRLTAEARLVLSQAQELWACASSLREAHEPELRIAIDAAYPRQRLLDASVDFQALFPATMLRIAVGLSGEILEAVRSGRVDLGISHLFGPADPQLALRHAGSVRLVPVCAAHHPIASHPPPHSVAELQRSTQIVHTERGAASTRDQGVLAPRTWRVTERSLKLELILQGVGWGCLPDAVVRGPVEAGQLVLLQPEPWPEGGHLLPIQSFFLKDHPLGPAGRWLHDRLTLSEADPGA